MRLSYRCNTGLDRSVQLLAWDGSQETLLAQTTEPIGDLGWPRIRLDHEVEAEHAGKRLILRVIGSESKWQNFDDFELRLLGQPSLPSQWESEELLMPAATEGGAYTASVAALVKDPEGGDLYFAKLSGPSWLTVAEDGTLSGTPGLADTGTHWWELSVTDRLSSPVTARLRIVITRSSSAPTFITNPIMGPNARRHQPYIASLEGAAIDEDEFEFSLLGGPSWLVLRPDGSLSGIPSFADVGVNNFTVKASDLAGNESTASLRILVENRQSNLLLDDFERSVGPELGNGWLERINPSRIFASNNPATRLVISENIGDSFTVLRVLGESYVSGESYGLNWNAARAGSAEGVMEYEVSIGGLEW